MDKLNMDFIRMVLNKPIHKYIGNQFARLEIDFFGKNEWGKFNKDNGVESHPRFMQFIEMLRNNFSKPDSSTNDVTRDVAVSYGNKYIEYANIMVGWMKNNGLYCLSKSSKSIFAIYDIGETVRMFVEVDPLENDEIDVSIDVFYFNSNSINIDENEMIVFPEFIISSDFYKLKLILNGLIDKK